MKNIIKTGEILSPRILLSSFKLIIMKKINFKAIAQELSKAEMKQIKGGYGGGNCPIGTVIVLIGVAPFHSYMCA